MSVEKAAMSVRPKPKKQASFKSVPEKKKVGFGVVESKNEEERKRL